MNSNLSHGGGTSHMFTWNWHHHLHWENWLPLFSVTASTISLCPSTTLPLLLHHSHKQMVEINYWCCNWCMCYVIKRFHNAHIMIKVNYFGCHCWYHWKFDLLGYEFFSDKSSKDKKECKKAIRINTLQITLSWKRNSPLLEENFQESINA